MAHSLRWVRQLRLFDPFPFSVYGLSQGILSTEPLFIQIMMSIPPRDL